MHDHPDSDALLDAIDAWLRQALDGAAAPADDSALPPLAGLDGRLLLWQGSLDRADAAAAGADRPLADAQAGWEAWLSRVRAARARLVSRAAPAPAPG